MKFNSNFRRILLCFIIVFCVTVSHYACGNEEKISQDSEASKLIDAVATDRDMGKTANHRVIVYYFHGKHRCPTCKRIERLAKEVVFDSFCNEINKGLLEFKVINVDEPDNKHFIKDYQLFTKSIVVSDIVEGKEKEWKTLQKVWEFIHSDGLFKEYVRNEIKAYLLNGEKI